MSRRTFLPSLILLALCVQVAEAGLISVDNGAAAIDGNGLMWANTVGIELYWDPAGEPGTAQAWIASLNANGYAGYNNWALPTADGGPANITTNQLGELFYTACGNAVGQASSLSNSGKDCSALSNLKSTIQHGMAFSNGSNPGNILISSSNSTGLVPGEGYYEWTVFDTSSSSERYWDGDTSYAGAVGMADVIAVRPVPTSGSLLNLSSGLCLFLGGLWFLSRNPS